MEQYSIKDLEKLTGLKANTIRVWERRYKLTTPSRTDTNRRRYDDIQLRRIINISILLRNGFKISSIAALSNKEIEDKVFFLSKDTNQSDTQIDSLIKLSITHNEKGINDLLIHSIMNRGFEETFTEIAFPFLRKIGIMWQTGSADIGSEHFITNLFLQRIILAIDSISMSRLNGGKRVILFLPENELHELGLLYYTYIIRKLGHETLYLGQTTPLSSVISVNDRWNADIIITGLMSGFPNVNPAEYVLKLGKSFPEQKVLVSGLLAEIAGRLNLSNVFPLRSASDLKDMLS